MKDHQQRIEDYLNGELSQADAATLREWLLGDEANMQTFVRISHQHGILRDTLSAAGELQQLTTDAPKIPASPCDAEDKTLPLRVYCFFARPTPFSLTVAAAFVCLVLTAMAFMAAPFYRALTQVEEEPSPDRYRIVGEVTGLYEPVWAVGDLGAHRGAYLTAGRSLELQQGAVEITFRSGAVVVLDAPFSFELVDDNQGRLASGTLVARVPPKAKGFTVETDQARVVDLGTEFGLRCSPNDAEVHIHDGVVEVHAENETRRLFAGQTVVASPAGLRETVAPSIAFVRELPRPAEITWEGPQDVSSADDLITAGELVVAVNCGGPATIVDGIEFQSGNLFGDPDKPGVSGLNGRSTGSIELDALLDTFSFGGGRRSILSLAGLTIGETYRVQLIYCDGRPSSANRSMRFADGRGNSVDLKNQAIVTNRPPYGQHAVGEFVATSNSQRLIVTTNKALNVHLNAYLVRRVAP